MNRKHHMIPSPSHLTREQSAYGTYKVVVMLAASLIFVIFDQPTTCLAVEVGNTLSMESRRIQNNIFYHDEIITKEYRGETWTTISSNSFLDRKSKKGMMGKGSSSTLSLVPSNSSMPSTASKSKTKGKGFMASKSLEGKGGKGKDGNEMSIYEDCFKSKKGGKMSKSYKKGKGKRKKHSSKKSKKICPSLIPTMSPSVLPRETSAPSLLPGATVAPAITLTNTPSLPQLSTSIPTITPVVTLAPSLPPVTTISPTTNPGLTSAPLIPPLAMAPPTVAPVDTSLSPTISPRVTIIPSLLPGLTAAPATSTTAPSLPPGTTLAPTITSTAATTSPSLRPVTTAAPTKTPGSTTAPSLPLGTTLLPTITPDVTTSPSLPPGTTATPTTTPDNTAAPSLPPGVTIAPTTSQGDTTSPSIPPGTTPTPTFVTLPSDLPSIVPIQVPINTPGATMVPSIPSVVTSRPALPSVSTVAPSLPPGTTATPTSNSLPSDLPSLSPMINSGTVAPATASIPTPTVVGSVPTVAPSNSISASPFRLTYDLTETREPNEFESSFAGDVALRNLEAFIRDQFSLTLGLEIEVFDATITETGVDPVTIDFEVSLSFSDDASYTPTPEEIDTLVELAFLQPNIDSLVEEYNALPADSPFSTTETIGYETLSGVVRDGLKVGVPKSTSSKHISKAEIFLTVGVSVLLLLTFGLSVKWLRARRQSNDRRSDRPDTQSDFIAIMPAYSYCDSHSSNLMQFKDEDSSRKSEASYRFKARSLSSSMSSHTSSSVSIRAL